jgi:hypothetical protein
MPRVGFELRTPVFERAKIVNALDRAVTLIGNETLTYLNQTYIKIEIARQHLV